MSQSEMSFQFSAALLWISFVVYMGSGFSIAAAAAGEDEEATETPAEEKALRVVPLLTTTPLTGTGVGVATSFLYRLDETSAKSQLQVGGQYSNTSSVTLFIRNNAFFRNNDIISKTAFLPAKTNSEFDRDDGEEVRYQIRSILVAQKLLFRMRNNFYAGGRVFYKKAEYTPNNAAGEDFLISNGVVDQKNGGFGGAVFWDSRENRYFPRQSYWVDVDADAAPSYLGADDSYYQLTINARYYGAGLKDADV